jgi:hypothetical protein
LVVLLGHVELFWLTSTFFVIWVFPLPNLHESLIQPHIVEFEECRHNSSLLPRALSVGSGYCLQKSSACFGRIRNYFGASL